MSTPEQQTNTSNFQTLESEVALTKQEIEDYKKLPKGEQDKQKQERLAKLFEIQTKLDQTIQGAVQTGELDEARKLKEQLEQEIRDLEEKVEIKVWGKSERKETGLAFEEIELNMLQEALEKKVTHILHYFSYNVDEMVTKKGLSFDKCVEDYESNSKENIPLFNLDLSCYNRDQVYKNLVYSLLGNHGEESDYSLNSISIRRAMDQDSRLSSFVNAVVKGTEKADAEKVTSGKFKTTDYQAQQGLVLRRNLLY